MTESIALLRRLLGPAGNPDRERVFRMQVTTCLHRACTPEEVDQLPEYFHTDPATDLAGGPVEILYESEEGSPSTRPCHNPTHQYLDHHNALLWFPLDCGRCEPCLARARLDPSYDDKLDRAPTLLSNTLRRLNRG